MKTGEQPAFPNSEALDPLMAHRMGLTKREYFAGLAMQGILAGNDFKQSIKEHQEQIARFAIETADELLKQLTP